MRHVVVTGAAGFIGRHLVAALQRDGIDVVGVDRRPCGAGITSLRTDLADGRDWRVVEVLREADAVFHLAGCPGVRTRDPGIARRRWHDNVLAGQRVLDAVPDDTPLIVASSSSVYGGTDDADGCREDAALRPRGGYARSKAELERRCRDRARRGAHVAVVRPFTVAGEGQRPDMALATWIDAGLAGRTLTIIGSPARTRDVTDVRDVVAGMIGLAATGTPTTVNLGTGHGFRLDDMVGAVARVLRRPLPVTVVAERGTEPAHTLADTTRCRRLLGFVPVTDLEDVVARQVERATEHAPAM